MYKTLLSTVAVLAMTAGASYAEQLTVFGPWLGPDQENVEAVLKVFVQLKSALIR